MSPSIAAKDGLEVVRMLPLESLRRHVAAALLIVAASSAAARALGDCSCSEYEAGSYQPAFSPRGSYLATVNSNWYPPSYFFWESIAAYAYPTGPYVFGYGQHSPVQHPTWSPDESRIAFVTFDALMVSDVQDGGSTPQILYRDDNLHEPAWSPAGDAIAIVRAGDIWSVPTAGGAPVQLTTGGGRSPAWSPDGTRLAYARGDSVYILTLGGGTRPFVRGEDPAWSPDGTWIAYSYGDIWVRAATGGTPVRVTFAPEAAFEPSWSADGRTLAYTIAVGNCLCIRTVDDLPDFRIDVQPLPWSGVKRLYR